LSNGNFLNLAEAELDDHIYRITKQVYVFLLFSQKVNVLTQVHNWKDKFENFQLRLGGILDGERFDYSFKDDFVGQCWTSESLSEAMWGIYANDPNERYLRIRSTPRRLMAALEAAHPRMPQDTCFVGKVQYKKEREILEFLRNGGILEMSGADFARSLSIKRHAFRHENEIRLLYFGDAKDFEDNGLHRYAIDPHTMVTQIMADPNRDRRNWREDCEAIRAATGFTGDIKRSKIYDEPDWDPPIYSSTR
jgi:hypothetical protein